MRIEARIFLGIAAFLVAIGVVYATATSVDDPGTTMLLLAGGMALLAGGYLVRQARLASAAAAERAPDEPLVEAYLPHASIWPFGIGLGAAVMANGLALGWWALLPGALLTAVATWGYARQSRRRD